MIRKKFQPSVEPDASQACMIINHIKIKEQAMGDKGGKKDKDKSKKQINKKNDQKNKKAQDKLQKRQP